MNTALRQDADTIIASSLKAVLPDAAVRRALESEAFCPQGGRILLVAVGKAAWQMAHTAVAALGRVDEGIVITKYGHVRGTIPGVTCYEAGHPVPDDRLRCHRKSTDDGAESHRPRHGSVPSLRRGKRFVRKTADPRRRATGDHEPSARRRSGYCRDEHDPQKAFRCQRRTFCPRLCSGEDIQYRTQRYFRRSPGYDCQRSCRTGQFHR